MIRPTSSLRAKRVAHIAAQLKEGRTAERTREKAEYVAAIDAFEHAHNLNEKEVENGEEYKPKLPSASEHNGDAAPWRPPMRLSPSALDVFNYGPLTPIGHRSMRNDARIGQVLTPYTLLDFIFLPGSARRSTQAKPSVPSRPHTAPLVRDKTSASTRGQALRDKFILQKAKLLQKEWKEKQREVFGPSEKMLQEMKQKFDRQQEWREAQLVRLREKRVASRSAALGCVRRTPMQPPKPQEVRPATARPCSSYVTCEDPSPLDDLRVFECEVAARVVDERASLESNMQVLHANKRRLTEGKNLIIF